MHRPFTNENFEHFSIDSVPLDRDVYLMDEKWIPEWEKNYLDFFGGGEFRNVGYISYAAVRSATLDALEISFYPNIMDRFHEVSVVLPRDAFVSCVDVYDYDEKPHIFVKSEWLESLHKRPYSAFVLIDAIGVKKSIITGQLNGGKLVSLRNRIDEIAEANLGVAFVSFADSLLLKANWYVGSYDSDINYSYEPEALIRLIPQISQAYASELNMSIYATITQGANEYGDTALTHRSTSGAHISLNSLGLPFAQLLAIDEAARHAIRNGSHGAHELYIDEMFFHSLRFKYGFEKHDQPNAPYTAPMSTAPGRYYCTSAESILANLETNPSTFSRRAGNV